MTMNTNGFLSRSKMKMTRPVEGFSDGMDTIGEAIYSNE